MLFRARMNQKRKVPSFINKLVKMLQAHQADELIVCLEDESVYIQNIVRFSEVVLPKFFKHSNFSSFNRQLNIYGFTKIKNSRVGHVYKHEFFKRKDSYSLCKIRRKAFQISSPENESSSKLSIVGPLKIKLRTSSRNQQLADENQRLSIGNRELQRKIEAQEKHMSQLIQILNPLFHSRPLTEGKQSNNRNHESQKNTLQQHRSSQQDCSEGFPKPTGIQEQQIDFLSLGQPTRSEDRRPLFHGP